MTQPLSRVPEPVDKESWEGVWMANGEEVLAIRFDTNHVAQIATLKWGESNRFEITAVEMVVTKGGKHNYLSLRDVSPDKPEQGYLLAQYSFVNDGQEAVIWPARLDPFLKAVDDGVLQALPPSSRKRPPAIPTIPPQASDGSDTIETVPPSPTTDAGKVERKPSDVCLSSPPEKILEFLEDPARNDLFEYDNPMVWRRIAGPKK